MGQSQSTTIDYYVQETRNYQPKPTNHGIMPSLALLLQSAQQERIKDCEIKLTSTGELAFLIKANESIDALQKFEGCVEIFKIEREKEERIFEGVIKKGQRKGFGIVYDQNQQIVYQGDFDDDLFEGWGSTAHYQGQFKNGKRHGWGVYQDPQNRIFYEGYFYEDLFHGIGYINVTEKQIKEFLEQNIFLKNPNFNLKYVGEWKNGKMHGKGKFVTVSSIYTGDFDEGLFQGQGKLISSSNIVEGKFLQGKLI